MTMGLATGTLLTANPSHFGSSNLITRFQNTPGERLLPTLMCFEDPESAPTFCVGARRMIFACSRAIRQTFRSRSSVFTMVRDSQNENGVSNRDSAHG